MLLRLEKLKEDTSKLNKKYKNKNSMANDLLDLSESINNNYKKLLIETVARNLVAWETSKDKKEGLLPNIYTTNRAMYKELTGQEFNLSKVKAKYYK